MDKHFRVSERLFIKALSVFLTTTLLMSCSNKMSEDERGEIVKILSEKITPQGIGGFRYEQSMSEVALYQNKPNETAQAIPLYKGVGILRYDLPDDKGEYGSPLHIYAASDCEIGKEYVTSTGEIIHKWNPESKLKTFLIQIRSQKTDWVNPLINDIVNGFTNLGYRKLSQQTNGPKTAILLSKGQFNLFIMDNGNDTVYILCGHNLMSTSVYKEFRDIFKSPKTDFHIL